MLEFYDPIISGLSNQNVPTNWGIRAIFTSEQACKSWIKRTDKESIEGSPDIINKYIEIISKIPHFENFISIGPGSGKIDKKILIETSNKYKKFSYLPIDISAYLLRTAYKKIHPQFTIPIGIVGDIEEGHLYIKNLVRQYVKGTSVYSILGNLVGGVDIGELNLLKNLSEIIEIDDYLLLSVGSGKFDDTSYEQTDQFIGWESLKELLAGGISVISCEPYMSVLSELNTRLIPKIGSSDIPKGNSMEIWDKITNSRIVSIKRYDLSEFNSWIENNFPFILLAQDNVTVIEGEVGMGIFLYKRR